MKPQLGFFLKKPSLVQIYKYQLIYLVDKVSLISYPRMVIVLYLTKDVFIK